MNDYPNRERALRAGCTFGWGDDWSVGDHTLEYDCYPDGGPETCEYVIMRDPFGEVVGSLGCIDDADDDYRRTIEEDLAHEYLAQVDSVDVGGLIPTTERIY